MKFMGPPEVIYADQPVKFVTRKALALFAYLVIEPGAHPREKLQAIFWPESEIHLAQSALRNTLVRIKDGLQAVDEPLLVGSDRIGFNFSTEYMLDLDLVTGAVADLEATAFPLDISSIPLLENAAEAVRGPFFEAFSLPDTPIFNDWILILRTTWGHRLNLIYEHLSIHQLESHLIHPAIETINRWLNLDRLNETAYRRLMRLYFMNGDRSAALNTYETCHSLLSQELGIEPSPDTEEVLAYIRSNPSLVPDYASRTEVGDNRLTIPFVGRSNEYQALVKSFHKVKNRKSQVVVVSGDSGMGKTRLANEFLNWAGTEHADILIGRAFEMSGGLPYQPIIEALRERLEGENAPEDLLDDVWLVELTRILPELRERYPDLPIASRDDSTARSRLFEAVARLSASLSTRHPLIWLVDDLQWADTGTLELLHYLARSWRTSHSPVLLVMLVGGEALSHRSTLRDWMSELTRDIPLTRLNLAPVGAPDMQQLVKSMVGESDEGVADLSAWLTAETNGEPIFVVETLSALEDYGALAWADTDNCNTLDPVATLANLKSMNSPLMAPSIQEVLLSRLEWLSQPASAVLAASAVIDRNCSFVRLCQVSGIDEQNCLNALDELLSARLILEGRDQARPYGIAHDRIREIICAHLSKARRQIYHRRALTTLTEGGTPSAELAYHALNGHVWEPAFRYSIAAGETALEVSAVILAEKHFQNALRLLREGKVESETAIIQQLYTRFGGIIEVQRRFQEALDLYDEMYTQAETHDDQNMKLAALVAQSRILSVPSPIQDVFRSESISQQALELAHALCNEALVAEIEWNLAKINR
jgi:DNA-binding SARP family transcriptional activator